MSDVFSPRGPYTDEEWADLERQVRECLAREGDVGWTTGELRKALEERRRVRFGALNGLLVVAHVDHLEAQVLRLAQALRVLRDTTAPNGYVENVCIRALEEAGVPDPPDEDHP